MNIHVVRILAAATLAIAALPSLATAHPRWFVDEARAGASLPFDSTAIFILLGAALYAVLAILLERSRPFEKVSRGLAMVAEDWDGFDWRLIAALAGILLLGNATMGVFLAPNIELPYEWLVTVGAWAQVLVGLLLLFQVTYSISGVLVLLVALVTLVLVPPLVMVDYALEFVALALALVFAGPAYCRLDRHAYRWLNTDPDCVAHLSVPIIRVGLGLTLIALAVHDKLIEPGVSLAFLDEYPFNFMPALGFDRFSNAHFVFAAGVAEITIGALIASGLATRVAVATLTGFFITTLLLLPPAELMGHFPLFGIAIMLILRGAGTFTFAAERECKAPSEALERVAQTAGHWIHEVARASRAR